MDARATFTDGFTPEARAAWSPARRATGLPREFFDGHPWHELSRANLDALRSARSVALDLNTLTGRSGVEAFAVGSRIGSPGTTIPVPGRLAPAPRDLPRIGPHVGSELLQVFPGVATELGTALGLLEEGDRVRLLWWPDAETTEPLREAGLHRDVVRLEVRRGDRLLALRLADRVSRDGPLRLVRPFDPEAEPGLAR